MEVDAEVEQVTVATAVCPITLRRGAIKSILNYEIAEVTEVEVAEVDAEVDTEVAEVEVAEVEVAEVEVEVAEVEVEVTEVVEDLKRYTVNQP